MHHGSTIQFQCHQDGDRFCNASEEFPGVFWFIFLKKLAENFVSQLHLGKPTPTVVKSL
jgi:predicted nucleic acid binding AN1-type Zn finger protein